MGEIKISYIHDPETGRRELWVDYESANDWMPAEHERRHKEILRQLVDRGKLEVQENRLRIPKPAWVLADGIAAELF